MPRFARFGHRDRSGDTEPVERASWFETAVKVRDLAADDEANCTSWDVVAAASHRH